MTEEDFYNRYWQDKHIKVNSFDFCPGEWTKENFNYHINFFKPFIKGNLLDFGCGNGQVMSLISNYCDSCYGVDISRLAVESAKKRFPELNFRLLDSGKIPYESDYFDTVCAIDVLEHILDTETVLEELGRILKPGGFLLIATNELTRLKTILIALFHLDNYFYPASPHIRHFTRKNLADFLHRKGFEAIAYQKNRTYFGFIPKGQVIAAKKK